MGDGSLTFKSINIDLRCRCGGSLKGEVTPPLANATLSAVADAFWTVHNNGGCGEAIA